MASKSTCVDSKMCFCSKDVFVGVVDSLKLSKFLKHIRYIIIGYLSYSCK